MKRKRQHAPFNSQWLPALGFNAHDLSRLEECLQQIETTDQLLRIREYFWWQKALYFKDRPWEVCLADLAVEVQRSFRGNPRDFFRKFPLALLRPTKKQKAQAAQVAQAQERKRLQDLYDQSPYGCQGATAGQHATRWGVLHQVHNDLADSFFQTVEKEPDLMYADTFGVNIYRVLPVPNSQGRLFFERSRIMYPDFENGYLTICKKKESSFQYQHRLSPLLEPFPINRLTPALKSYISQLSWIRAIMAHQNIPLDVVDFCLLDYCFHPRDVYLLDQIRPMLLSRVKTRQGKRVMMPW